MQPGKTAIDINVFVFGSSQHEAGTGTRVCKFVWELKDVVAILFVLFVLLFPLAYAVVGLLVLQPAEDRLVFHGDSH